MADDLTPQEVAQRTGVPLETARTHIKRGVDRLRTQLDRQAGSRSAWVVPLLHIDVLLDRGGAQAVHVTAGKRSDCEFEIAKGVTVRGRVITLAGQPVAGAKVYALREAHHDLMVFLAQTDGAGTFELRDVAPGLRLFARADAEGRFSTTEVPWGDVALLARGAGLQDHLLGGARVRVDKGTTSQVVVHLRPGAVIFGTVRDEEGKPYAGIALHAEFRGTVELGELERGFGHYLADRTCVTDADGNYRLDGLFEAETPCFDPAKPAAR